MAMWRSRAVVVAILVAVPVLLANCRRMSLGIALPLRAEAPTLADVQRFIDRTLQGAPPRAPCPDISG